jgi:nucleotide-binding universal stress UspA family protein
MSWLPKSSVVVPIDFSDESVEAVDTALEMVEGASHIHVIHVLPVLGATEVGLGWEVVDDDTMRGRAEKAIRERLAERKYEGFKIAIAFGDPGSEIAAFAESIKADLIVIPSHGRTGLRHLLIGSVAERVCRLAHCPVLVLRN